MVLRRLLEWGGGWLSTGTSQLRPGPWQRRGAAPARASEVALRLQMQANLGRNGRLSVDWMQQLPEESVCSRWRRKSRVEPGGSLENSHPAEINSQCGGAFLLSSSVCRPSCRPSACCVPTLCAVSVAVMSIWAYLVELFPAKDTRL